MKKIVVMLILGFSVLAVNAQKVSGTVYSEHDAIAKTKAMWAAFVKGDKEAFVSFFADSVYENINGTYNLRTREYFGGVINWWKGFENLSFKDDSPASPDAINYTQGGLWVQDWLRLSGTHKSTGINIDLPVHNLYSFNKEGKINSVHQYYDSHFFDDINNSSRTIENGTVYKNHPYIVTVRKMVNAWCAENLDSLAKFYSPNAIFFESPFKQDKFISLEESLKEAKNFFDNYDNIKMVQSGYPDCIYYAKDGFYQVYSWWTLSYTTKDGKKQNGIPMMITDGFDKDGKINVEFVYYSTNHFE